MCHGASCFDPDLFSHKTISSDHLDHLDKFFTCPTVTAMFGVLMHCFPPKKPRAHIPARQRWLICRKSRVLWAIRVAQLSKVWRWSRVVCSDARIFPKNGCAISGVNFFQFLKVLKKKSRWEEKSHGVHSGVLHLQKSAEWLKSKISGLTFEECLCWRAPPPWCGDDRPLCGYLWNVSAVKREAAAHRVENARKFHASVRFMERTIIYARYHIPSWHLSITC